MLSKKGVILHPLASFIFLVLHSLVFLQPLFLEKAELRFGAFILFLPLIILSFFKAYKLRACFKALFKLNIFIILVIFFLSFKLALLALLLEFLRLNILLFFSLLLFFNENIFYLSYAFQKSPKLSLLLFFTLKFFLIFDNLRKDSLQALKLRCKNPSFLNKLKAYSLLISSLILACLKESKHMNWLLKSRGFKGVLPVFTKYYYKKQDLFLFILCLIQLFYAQFIL